MRYHLNVIRSWNWPDQDNTSEAILKQRMGLLLCLAFVFIDFGEKLGDRSSASGTWWSLGYAG